MAEIFDHITDDHRTSLCGVPLHLLPDPPLCPRCLVVEARTAPGETDRAHSVRHAPREEQTARR